MIHGKKAFENIVEKGENAGNKHFLFLSTMFSNLPKTNSRFLGKFILSSANVFSLDQSKNLLFGKELSLLSGIHNPVYRSPKP